jgi:hypothetical protein
VRTVRLQKLQRLLDKRTQIVVEMKAKIEEVADEYLTQDHQYQPTRHSHPKPSTHPIPPVRHASSRCGGITTNGIPVHAPARAPTQHTPSNARARTRAHKHAHTHTLLRHGFGTALAATSFALLRCVSLDAFDLKYKSNKVNNEDVRSRRSRFAHIYLRRDSRAGTGPLKHKHLRRDRLSSIIRARRIRAAVASPGFHFRVALTD